LDSGYIVEINTLSWKNQMMNLYVGNLPYQTTEDDLRNAFSAHGEVSRVSLIIDRDTGRSKGFGFVEMGDRAAGEAAISSLDGTDFDGRSIKVNEAKPREERPRRMR
jgi:RNA recognition motif-containing protein